jgi:hypothetical protein
VEVVDAATSPEMVVEVVEVLEDIEHQLKQ